MGKEAVILFKAYDYYALASLAALRDIYIKSVLTGFSLCFGSWVWQTNCTTFNRKLATGGKMSVALRNDFLVASQQVQ